MEKQEHTSGQQLGRREVLKGTGLAAMAAAAGTVASEQAQGAAQSAADCEPKNPTALRPATASRCQSTTGPRPRSRIETSFHRAKCLPMASCGSVFPAARLGRPR